MNSLSASILLSLIVVVLSTSRRWALLGMAAGVLYLTQAAAIDVLGFNMFAVRFLELAGFIRVMARREFSFSNLNELDRLFLFLYAYTTIVFLLRSNEGQVYAIGVAVDAALCYFIFRGLVADIDDFRWFLGALIVLLIPYVYLLFIEMRTAQNPFSLLGGPVIVEQLRKGRVRCHGSFRNSDLLGTLGASFLPLYLALTMGRKDRKWGLIGIALCLAIVFFSNSGGPIAAAAVAVAGWLLWPMRKKMRVFRRGLVSMLVALALVMKAPIWFLPGKISDFTGGDGYHRSKLIDMAIKTLREWWLWGMSIAQTADWFPYINKGTGAADITNQYVAFGLTGGLMAMVLFIWLLVKCYENLGKALNIVRANSTAPAETEFLLWGLGVMLAVHIANWFGITYFDQTYVLWFMQLAAIVNISHICCESYSPSVGKATHFQHAAPQQTQSG